MKRLRQYVPLAATLAALCAALVPTVPQAQDSAPPAQREVRYCTNCAMVEEISLRPAGSAGGKRYELVLRYTSGNVKKFSYDNDPGFRVGEKVKDNNGVVVRDVADGPAP